MFSEVLMKFSSYFYYQTSKPPKVKEKESQPKASAQDLLLDLDCKFGILQNAYLSSLRILRETLDFAPHLPLLSSSPGGGGGGGGGTKSADFRSRLRISQDLHAIYLKVQNYVFLQ